MRGNPILDFFKLAATCVLAFLIWLAFMQGSHTQEKVLELKAKQDASESRLVSMEQAMREHLVAQREAGERSAALEGAIRGLTDVLARGGFRNAGPSQDEAPPRDPPREASSNGTRTAPTSDAATPPPPRWLSARAQALWGVLPDYLQPDPRPIPVAPLDQPGADRNGTLRLYYGSQPSKIGPLISSDALVTNRIEQYCLLTAASPHARDASKYVGELAVRVQVNEPDYTEWTLFLRDDVYWHQPLVDLEKYPHLRGRRKVTANDFKFTLDLIMNPDVDCEHLRNYFSECSGCEVVDDYCLIVRWKKPQFNSIAFTLGNIQPLPAFAFGYDEVGGKYEPEQVGLAYNEHWLHTAFVYIGCGPYYVKELDPGSHLLLVRNESYFGDLPAIREIRMTIKPDATTGMKMVEAGDADAETFYAKEWIKRTVDMKDQKSIFTSGALAHKWVQGTGFSFIGWKNTHPIFRDKMVRRALTMACDRPRILRNLFRDEGTIATGTQAVDSPFNPPNIEPWPFDLAAAARLLAELGWIDRDGDGILEKEIDGAVRPFRFRATVPSGTDIASSIFEIFKDDLSKIGIDMQVDLLEWKVFVERLDSRDFEVVTLSWMNSGWESDSYQIWHSSQADVSPSSNFVEYRNPKVDELIVRLREVFDHDTRVKMQREIQEIFHDEQPYTFLISPKSPFVWVKNAVGNVEESCEFQMRPRVRFSPMYMKAR